MSRNTRVVAATPQRVWDVLCDGWLYPVWVVGASRMREVDDHWPAVGARLHHSAGVWPLLLDDTTEVVEVSAPHHLRLRARGRPFGEAEVDIRLRETGSGTEITLVEDAVRGPGALLPKPLRQPPLHWRNTETLDRLAFVVENR